MKANVRHNALVRALKTCALAGLLAIPATVHAVVDLSGAWRILASPDDEVEIVQDGTTLWWSGRPGVVDPETGTFSVVMRRDPGCPDPPFTVEGTLIAPDILRVEGSGYMRWFTGVCELRVFSSMDLERVGSAGTPTATPSPRPTATPRPPACIGDCNRDRKVTIHELMLLVQCYGPRPTIDRIPCGVECADANASNAIEVNELVMAVNNALAGCPQSRRPRSGLAPTKPVRAQASRR